MYPEVPPTGLLDKVFLGIVYAIRQMLWCFPSSKLPLHALHVSHAALQIYIHKIILPTSTQLTIFFQICGFLIENLIKVFRP